MTEFRDLYPNLSKFIDVGGDRYYVGSDNPIDLVYKSRNDFLNTFTQNVNNDQEKYRIEYLLRKYMYYRLKEEPSYVFDKKEEKQQLIDILKKRSKQLSQSKEVSRSLLKNAFFQRILTNLQKIIQDLEGAPLRVMQSSELKNLQFLKNIPEEKITQLILELSWYLLHPEKVPKDIFREWVDIIKKLDQLRIHDFVDLIHDIEEKNNLAPLGTPLNYFERIHIGKSAKSNNALEDAIKMATTIQDDKLQESLKFRLKLLLDILQAKKYLNNSLPKNELGLSNINESIKERLSKQLIINPQAGGNQVSERKLGAAMRPLFDYFKSVFNPVYGFIESNVKEWNQASDNNIIPSLLSLLHLCQQIRPFESKEGGQPTYGIYRVDNTPSDLLSYVNRLLIKTETYVGSIQKDEDKNTFQQQILSLPKVRLTTLINPIANPGAFKDPDEFPYIQLCTVGGNITIPPKESFLDSSHPKLTEEAYRATTDFFHSDELYLVITKGDNTREHIPLYVHTVDFADVDVEDMTIPINSMPDHYFHKKDKENELYLDNIIELKPYVFCNDAEIALSILIAFKDRMPI